MKAPRKIISELKNETEFLVAVHINPDGDTLGSALALGEALQSSGKRCVLYSRDTVPGQYRFLPGSGGFVHDAGDCLKCDPVLILVDCNSAERAALEGVRFRKSIVIDHHETETGFGDLRWIVPEAAATGLMVYAVIKGLGIRPTRAMAVNLYAATAVDTGTFRYSNTTAEVLRSAAELVQYGAEPNLIADNLYENWQKNRFDLLVMTLNTLEIREGVATTHVTREMFRRTRTGSEDTENFSNYPRKIDSVEISALFRELGSGLWRASLRSKGDVNVAEIARLFGGGGHRNAAGFRFEGDLASARKALLKAYRKLRHRR